MIDGFFRQPPSYERTRDAIRSLGEAYPCLRTFPIGKSALGRSIFALGFGDLRRASLFVGGVHGMEWLTTLLLFRFARDLLRAIETGEPLADIDVARALESRAVVIIPCLNPDGVEIVLRGAQSAKSLAGFVEKASGGDTAHWQANARGVDLNHNFDAGWQAARTLERAAGINAPCPTRFGGTAPHSEPESLALVNYCIATQPRQAYAFHSQGEEIYWRYGDATPARSQLMAQVLAASSGYTLATPDTLASHAGFKDWFIERTHRPAFTVEIGRGKNPLPLAELDPIYARLLEMLLLALLL